MAQETDSLVSYLAAKGMVIEFINNLHPSQVKDGRITVSPEQLVAYTENVIDRAMDSLLDVMPDFITNQKGSDNATDDHQGIKDSA
jgi:hypothetical protein